MVFHDPRHPFTSNRVVLVYIRTRNVMLLEIWNSRRDHKQALVPFCSCAFHVW
jgi:hypothetical protein